MFLSVPGLLAGLYTPDVAVLALAGTLIPLAGVFQVFDGLQVVAIGVLRGLADTRTPFIISLFGYWIIGMPVGLVLAYPLGYGVAGLWWGLVVGLGAVAGVLVYRVKAGVAAPGALARVKGRRGSKTVEEGVEEHPLRLSSTASTPFDYFPRRDSLRGTHDDQSGSTRNHNDRHLPDQRNRLRRVLGRQARSRRRTTSILATNSSPIAAPRPASATGPATCSSRTRSGSC